MKITKLYLENYKSFNSIEIQFNDFNIIVGANAAGKSNLMSSFRFIKNIITYGTENAVSLHGGISNLSNSNSIKEAPIKISFDVDLNNSIRNRAYRVFKDEKLALKLNKIKYTFSLQPYKRRDGYSIAHDELNLIYEINSHDSTNKENKHTFLDETVTTTYLRKSSQSNVSVIHDFSNEEYKKLNKSLNEQSGFILFLLNHDKKELILNKLSIFLPPGISSENFIELYDFDPKLLKKSCSLVSLNMLDENGSNLATILQGLLKNKDNRKQLISLLKDALPFISELNVEKNYDQSYSFKVKEKYSNKVYFSNFLSDGTVSIIAIIVALYFEDLTSLVLLEEPERNIHPILLKKVVEMARDISTRKQIFFTTHNSEILRFVNIDDIFFVKRCDEGYSNVTKPVNSNVVKTFIENDLGIDDLFLQGFLEE